MTISKTTARKIVTTFLISCWVLVANAALPTRQDSIEVAKIWDQAVYSAFTDLIRFDNHFYCSFREGLSHVGGKNSGKVRIIKSKDGKQWESVALLAIEDLDLRDPKLSVTPQNQLMVILAGAVFEEGMIKELFPMVSFSDQTGMNFTTPERSVIDPAVVPTKDWIWRVTWHKGVGYAVDYQLKENARDRKTLKKDAWLAYLLKTKDGKYFEKVAQLAIDDLPNEATVRFDCKDNMYILIRREAKDQMGVLAKSAFPYQNWTYNPLKVRLGGPNFLFLNKDRLVMGTRYYEGNEASTALLVTDLKGEILKTLKLPSGGDTSYPGMVLYKKKLWVSYYSHHEGKSNIYLAKVPLKILKTK